MFQRKEECDKFYKMGRVLGQGSFATVKLAICKADNTKWAIKVIKRSCLAPEDEQALATEVAIMERVRHPNIIGLKEVFDCPANMYMVMEVMTGGELFDRIVQKEHYSEGEAKNALRQIVSAIGYCHDLGIVHRDLKPENLL
jgi:calcium/calmodulin-dependent protein kinase I